MMEMTNKSGVNNNTLSIPLSSNSTQYRQLNDNNEYYFGDENNNKNNKKNIFNNASSLVYHLFGCGLIVGTFYIIYIIIQSGMSPGDFSDTNRLHLQIYKRPFIDINDKYNIELGIRLKPNAIPCTKNMCWEERQGIEGIVVRLKKGKHVSLKVENLLNEPTMLHWHGIVVPFEQDGVPGLTGQAIDKNGGMANYDFDIEHPGTFFMHSHFKWQHQQRLGAFFLAIDGEDVEEEIKYNDATNNKKRDLLLFLEDGMSRHPECASGNADFCPNKIPIDTKDIPYEFVQNDFDESNPCICPVFLGRYEYLQCSCNGKPRKGAMCSQSLCNKMKSNNCKQCPSVTNADLSNTEDEAFNMCRYDEKANQLPSLDWLHARFGTLWGSYDRLLANGKTLKDPQIINVAEGDEIVLRIINSAGSVCFWIYMPNNIDAEVQSVDGINVQSGVTEKKFPICSGQRMDIKFTIPLSSTDEKSPKYSYHPILAQWQGERNRTGIILKAKKQSSPSSSAAAAADNNNAKNEENNFQIPSELADKKSPLIYYDLEKKLKAKYDDVPKITYRPDEVEEIIPMNLTSGWLHAFSMNHVLWDLAKFEKDGMVVMNPKPIVVYENKKYCIKMQNNGHTGHPMHLHGHNFQVVELDGEILEDGPVRDTIQIPPRCHSATICFQTNNPGQWLFHCHMIEHIEHGMATSIVYV